MNCSDIEKIAASGGEMPHGLKLPEQLLFLTLQGLYHNFKTGAINREIGRKEKTKILAAYKGLEMEQRILDEHMALRKRLSFELGSLHKCGCPTCQKVARVFDGIEKRNVPEDIAELQARNDKLVEMVRELSERNAELSTKLERMERNG